jgi:hypothetical protein
LVYVTATGGATLSAALAMSFDDDGPLAMSEAPRILAKSSAVTTDWLPGAITVGEYGGLEVSDAKRLKALEDENAKLKKLLAEAMLDNAMLKDEANLPRWPAGNVEFLS